MKRLLITFGILGIIFITLLVSLFFKSIAVVRRARVQALYSAVGAWQRIQEYAHAQGKSNYIAVADTNFTEMQANLIAWRDTAPAGTDFSALEKMRRTAYDTTDRNIKNGQNPLAYLDSPAYTQQTGGTNSGSSPKTPGMSEFEYLACDGGPHLVLPSELSLQWKGAGSLLGVVNPLSQYRRAVDAVTNQHMALISVGTGQAMVLADPPLSAWGRSPEGWIDIYYLDAWPDTNIDAMLKRAVAATATGAMTNTGKVMTLTKPGLILLFAGDKPGNTAYGEHPIPIPPGSYQILEAHYKGGATEEVHMYRLRPKDK